MPLHSCLRSSCHVHIIDKKELKSMKVRVTAYGIAFKAKFMKNHLPVKKLSKDIDIVPGSVITCELLKLDFTHFHINYSS